jgi:hypothetical protein
VNDVRNFFGNLLILCSVGIFLLTVGLLVVIFIVIFVTLIPLVLLIGLVLVLLRLVVPFLPLLIRIGSTIKKFADLIETLSCLVLSALNALIDHKLSIFKISLVLCFDLWVYKFPEEHKLGM